MSEVTTVEEQPQQKEKNVINYNPVFPTLTASVLMDFDNNQMAEEVYKSVGDKTNITNGYSSLLDNPKAVENLPKGQDLLGAIYQISLSFLREMKVEFNPEKCNMRTWLTVHRKGSYAPKTRNPLSQLSGVYYIKADKDMSSLVLHNPTTPLRSHEHLPMRIQDFTAFTAPSMAIQPEENTLFIWPSWLEHEIPEMQVGGPLICVNFTIDFLPSGA